MRPGWIIVCELDCVRGITNASGTHASSFDSFGLLPPYVSEVECDDDRVGSDQV